MGADATINYSTQNLRDALKALTGGKGPDVVYDPVGGDLAEPAFRSIAWRGRYLVVGFRRRRHSGAAAEPGLLKGASSSACSGAISCARTAGLCATGQQLAQWYARARSSRSSTSLPMSELNAAYARMGCAPGARQAGAVNAAGVSG
jgi:NADPH2:quinone reductase